MNRIILAVLAAGLLFAACAVAPGHYGAEVVIAPPLPTIVVLEDSTYYYHDGYHYHYRGNSWYYSTSRGGPWKDLPKDRYPKETRFKGKEKHDGNDKGEKREHEKHHR